MSGGLQMNKTILLTLGACLVGISAISFAQSQQYPVKPVRVIVSTVPGPLDAYARIISEKITTSLKQQFFIDNRPGAGGNIATEIVSKSQPDGQTLLFAIDTTFTVNPSLYKKL